jgi:putative membrane protein
MSHAQDTQAKERHSQKELIAMFSGFRYGYGLWFLLPVLLVVLLFGKFFWIVIPLLFIGLCLLPRFGFRNRWMPAADSAYQPATPAQLSALDILTQRYARGEIDAVTYEQMRERLSNADRPRE